MRVIRMIIVTAVVLGYAVISSATATRQISLTDSDADWIGGKIFFNECSGKDNRLVSWNRGEDFMSLGIGHFIWYPENRRGPYDETFPALISFIKERGRVLPDWLQGPNLMPCPWQSREEFLRNMDSPGAHQLRELLVETKDLQLLFIINRLKAALPKILKAAPEEAQSRIEQQFYRVASTPAGVYALVDYVNFKGEGVLSAESYKGQGWGLLQVLERMNGREDGEYAVRDFAYAADEILTERVTNSPPERDEHRWLLGWRARLNTYVDVKK